MVSELDVTVRLRDCAEQFAGGPSAPVMLEAAFTIERLRVLLEEVRADAQVIRQQGMLNR